MATLEVKTRILPGGRIEIPDTGLPEGREATVRIVVVEESPRRSLDEILKDYPGARIAAEAEPGPTKRSFLENLGDYKGGQSFRSVEEVDRYIREERESWGD